MAKTFPHTAAAWQRLKRAVADFIVAYVDPEASRAKRRLETYEGLADRWGKVTINRVEPDADGRLLGSPYPMQRMSREEAEKLFGKPQ